jgi:cation diffusion facilitator CzcD-associated flavoprotein CzcO
VGYPDCWFAKFFERRVVADAKGAILKTGRKDLIEKLKPTSPLGCKRGSFSADYYQTVARPNVSIVSEEIVSVNGNEIISKNGTKAEFDLLVLGTGFKTNTGIRNDITSRLSLD